MIRLNRSKFGNWPSGPSSRLANPTFFMPGFMGGGGGLVDYTIPYSLRFRASNSARLVRSITAGGSRTRATFHFDIKRILMGTNRGALFGVRTANNDTDYLDISFNDNDQLVISGGTTVFRVTSKRFRDPLAHYFITIAFDTSQATANNRIRVYDAATEITSFDTLNNPTLNANLAFNQTADHAIGVRYNGSGGFTEYFDGVMSDVFFITNQYLAGSDFCQTSLTSGQPVRKRFTGTFGIYDSYLKFADASAATAAAIGKDSSGNGNNWTPSGISVTAGETFDQLTDTPTNNYATLNSVDRSSVGTLSWGGLRWISANSGAGTNGNGARSTLGMTSGKWYAEFRINDTSGSPYVGIANENHDVSQYLGGNANSWSFSVSNGQKGNNTSFTSYATYSRATGDIIMIFFDADTKSVWWGANGSWFASGNPANGTNPAYTGMTGNAFFFAVGYSDNTGSGTTSDWNFGQRPFAYTPPSGGKALCTGNLPTPTIPRGDDAFQAVTYTGTGSTLAINSLRFQPDLLALKVRSGAANSWAVFDSLRGRAADLKFNETSAEGNQSAGVGLTSFDSNGFTLGTQIAGTSDTNVNTRTYVGHAWRRGAAYGFDVVTYTGTGSARTVSHGLNAVPHMMIVKDRSNGTGHWAVYHRNANASPQNGGLYLSLTSAFDAAGTSFWNNTSPTSSVFTVGTGHILTNQSGVNYVAYLWTEIAGFSRFGSYTGNGNADGRFVWCGFKPRWVMIKRTDSANTWWCYDTARNTFNVTNAILGLNDAAAESTSFGGAARDIDITANGFKLRTANDPNGSSGNFVFAAFAESPLKYATAR